MEEFINTLSVLPILTEFSSQCLASYHRNPLPGKRISHPQFSTKNTTLRNTVCICIAFRFYLALLPDGTCKERMLWTEVP